MTPHSIIQALQGYYFAGYDGECLYYGDGSGNEPEFVADMGTGSDLWEFVEAAMRHAENRGVEL